ncbi:MAG: HAMP domain-containing protein [Actinobacteria bacterium]|nr:MAG: HAMP domain-containing protein [Actinomycetota bacterium]
MPLRLKLLIALIVLVFAGLAVSNVVTYTSLRSFLQKRVDQQLTAAEFPVGHSLTEQSFPSPGPGPDQQFPGGTYGQLRGSDGSVLSEKSFMYGTTAPPKPSLPPTLPRSGAPSTGPDIFTTKAVSGSTSYRVLVDRVTIRVGGQSSPGTLIVAIPLTDLEDTLSNLRRIEGIVSLAVLLGLGFLSWWLVRRGLRPLERIGATAGAIAAGDLSRRVEPADDRTEIGRLGIALNAMLAQIEAAFEERRASERRLRRFVADASHELRTPLTSIRGYAELFRRGADSRPEDLAKSMQRIEAEASRMGVLVDDLLLLARLDQGRPLERERVDLGRIASDAVESARAIEPDRPIDLSVSGPIELMGDEGRLRQVLDNLLDNVRVHTPQGTPVQVKVQANHHEALLSVTDGGPGLSQEVADRVFERFYRGDPARSRGTGGVGLGLSIVSAIVDAHGGSVTAASPGGGGAAFEVRLPVRDAGAAGSTSEQPDGSPSGAPPL